MAEAQVDMSDRIMEKQMSGIHLSTFLMLLVRSMTILQCRDRLMD